jgi:WD domain, G-beta repeat
MNEFQVVEREATLLEFAPSPCSAIAISGDGNWLAAGLWTGAVHLFTRNFAHHRNNDNDDNNENEWDLLGEQQIAPFSDRHAPLALRSLELDYDGTLLLSGSQDRFVRVTHVESSTLLGSFQSPSCEAIQCITWSLRTCGDSANVNDCDEILIAEFGAVGQCASLWRVTGALNASALLGRATRSAVERTRAVNAVRCTLIARVEMREPIEAVRLAVRSAQRWAIAALGCVDVRSTLDARETLFRVAAGKRRRCTGAARRYVKRYGDVSAGDLSADGALLCTGHASGALFVWQVDERCGTAGAPPLFEWTWRHTCPIASVRLSCGMARILAMVDAMGDMQSVLIDVPRRQSVRVNRQRPCTVWHSNMSSGTGNTVAFALQSRAVSIVTIDVCQPLSLKRLCINAAYRYNLVSSSIPQPLLTIL